MWTSWYPDVCLLSMSVCHYVIGGERMQQQHTASRMYTHCIYLHSFSLIACLSNRIHGKTLPVFLRLSELMAADFGSPYCKGCRSAWRIQSDLRYERNPAPFDQPPSCALLIYSLLTSQQILRILSIPSFSSSLLVQLATSRLRVMPHEGKK